MTSAPELVQTELGRRMRQAQRSFTEARLRKDSGAAIPPQEFQNDRRMYFPAAGDSDVVLDQKRRARQTVLDALELEGSYAEPKPPPRRLPLAPNATSATPTASATSAPGARRRLTKEEAAALLLP
jgi:hypothetical protein